MAQAQGKRYVIEVEKGEPGSGEVPSKGPVYRSVFAEKGFPPLPEGLFTCWDLFEYVSSLLTVTLSCFRMELPAITPEPLFFNWKKAYLILRCKLIRVLGSHYVTVFDIHCYRLLSQI